MHTLKLNIEDSKSNALNYLIGYEDKIELLILNPYMGVEY